MIAYLRTASGRLIDTLNLKSEDINAYDIAWSLSNTNRYAGHTPVPWDVLSHTGLAYQLYVRDMKGVTDINYLLGLLLHDAAEAYLGDMLGPLKGTEVGKEFRRLEDKIIEKVFTRFGVQNIDWTVIDRYDHQATHIEISAFYPEMVGNNLFTQEQYHMDRYPTLVKAKVTDYIELLKQLSINEGVSEVGHLFELSDIMDRLVTVERVNTTPQTTTGDVAGRTVIQEIEGLRL